MEARAGIEPAYTDLQSAASPLRHRARNADLRGRAALAASISEYKPIHVTICPAADLGLADRDMLVYQADPGLGKRGERAHVGVDVPGPYFVSNANKIRFRSI